ncbi:MAG: chloride channel protein [Blastocatellales bacterium]
MNKRETGKGRAWWYRFQIRARRLFNNVPLPESQKIYILTLLIGVLSGLAAVSFHLLIDYFQKHLIYSAGAITTWWRWPLVILLPVMGGLLAGAGLHFFAPEARGSGIPQVKTAYHLDGGRIAARVIPGKMLLASFNIGTGASLGREGPTVQICAAIASLLGRIFAISRRRLQSLVPVGAAAGLAAAFNTPIAAITFTLEEILGNVAGRQLGSIVIAAVIAAVIERSILGEHPVFTVPQHHLHQASELIFYAILGIIAGLVSAGFKVSLLRLRSFFRRQHWVPQWASPGAGGFLVGVCGAVAIWLTGSVSVFGVGYGQLSAQLQSTLPLKIMLVLAICKFAATVISYGSGSSGGIFGPSLYLGGMIGGATGLMTRYFLGNPLIEPEAFALVGMGAVFAGVVRAPVTSIIMIFEMTNNYSIILPLMIANITSYLVATELSPTPIYDALLKQDDIHLPHSERQHLKQLRVSDAMTRNLVTIGNSLTVAEAFDYVQSLPEVYRTFPVVDETGRLTGLLTINDLKRALAAGRNKTSVTVIADRKIVTTHPEHSLDMAMVKLGREGISQLPVVSRQDHLELVGIITLHDIAKTLSRADESQAKTGETP